MVGLWGFSSVLVFGRVFACLRFSCSPVGAIRGFRTFFSARSARASGSSQVFSLWRSRVGSSVLFAGTLMLTVLFRQYQIGGFKSLWWFKEGRSP